LRLGMNTAAVGLLAALFLVAAASAGYASAPPAQGLYLSLSPLPPRLPTSSSGDSSFPALVVSVNNAQGNPTVLPSDTEVYLSSSSAVLGVQPTVTIPAGKQFAVANVTTTETPGNSTVTAVAPGFQSATATFTTYVPRGYPTQLVVFPLPDVFPAGAPVDANITVEVVDGAGLPARTIQNTPVQLTSSDTSVVEATGTTIPANQTIGFGELAIQGQKSGTVSVTASASGFVSDTTTVTVTGPMNNPNQLEVSAPADLPADGGTYDVLTISLTSNGTTPAVSRSGTSVLLTSSRPDLVSIDVSGSVLVPAGRSFVTVPITTSASSGTAFITASSPNFVSSTVQVNTVSIPPTKLGVYLSDPRALVSPVSDALNMVVQLQDSQGVPADARTSATVIVSFSNTTLSETPMTLTIPKGADLAYATVPLAEGTEGVFTAISNGLSGASAPFSATELGVTYSIGPAAQTIYPNQTDTVYFSLRYQGTPLSGASLTWSASGGTITSAAPATDASGSASAVFTPSGTGLAVVNVTAKDPVVGSVSTSTRVFVVQPPVEPKQTLLSHLLSNKLYLGAIVGGAVVLIVLIIIVVVRRRRGGSIEDEDSLGLGPAPGEGTALDLRARL
jgi:hypothetical protein